MCGLSSIAFELSAESRLWIDDALGAGSFELLPLKLPVPIPKIDESEFPIPDVSELVHDSSLVVPQLRLRMLDGAAEGGVVRRGEGEGAMLGRLLEVEVVDDSDEG